MRPMYQSRSFSFTDLIENEIGATANEHSTNLEGALATEDTTPVNTTIDNSSQTFLLSSPDITCYPKVKKIRFESTTGEQIAMFEFIARYSGANVALQGTASQSSDRNNGEPLHASRAIDGDNITYSHTNDSNATWEIDFDQTYQIDSVMILNRYCGDDFAYDPLECLCRLSNSTLMLMSENNEVLSAKSLGDTCNQSIIYVQFGKDYPCHTSPNSVYAHHEKSTDNFTLYSHNQTDDLEFDTGVDIYFSIALVYSGSRWFGTLEFGLEKDFKLDQLSCKWKRVQISFYSTLIFAL